MQQRLGANDEVEGSERDENDIDDETNREDIEGDNSDQDERALTNLRDIASIEERLNNIGGSASLGMSLGVNIGSYGYQNNGRGNLLQQINY